MMNECIFCKIVKGEIPCHKIYETDQFLAFLDVNPIREGHILIIPKEHIDYVFDMSEKLYDGLFAVAKILAPKLQQLTHAVKIGIAIEGIAIRHVHLHLVPVNKGNDLDPCLAKSAGVEVLKEFCERMHALLR